MSTGPLRKPKAHGRDGSFDGFLQCGRGSASALDLLLEFIVLRHQLAVLQRTGTRRAVLPGPQLGSLHGPPSALNEAPIVSSWITQSAGPSLWLLHPIVTVATISSDRCRFVAPTERHLRAKAILSIEVVVLQRRLSY
jgi:hypothetical protein